jgi:gamma-glutamyl hercynylcysteine S-oxide hydrolase
VLVWLLVRHRLASGAGLPAALAAVTERAGPLADRLNLMVTNGTEVAATAYGESLFWRPDGLGVLIASEPTDDPPAGSADPGAAWRAVPDRHVLHATPDGVQIERL